MVNNIVNFSQVKNIANVSGNLAESLAVDSGTNYTNAVSNLGFKVLDGGKTVGVSSSVGADGVATYGKTLLESSTSDTATGKIVQFKGAQSTTTQTGENLTKGALLLDVPTPMIFMGILQGCGYGYELYNEYPEFWTDLSNAVFTDYTGNSQFNTPLQLYNGGQVVIRALEDGGLRAYCDKQTIVDAVQVMDELNVFKNGGELSPTWHNTGLQTVNTSGVELGVINKAITTTGSPITQNSLNRILSAIQSIDIEECDSIAVTATTIRESSQRWDLTIQFTKNINGNQFVISQVDNRTVISTNNYNTKYSITASFDNLGNLVADPNIVNLEWRKDSDINIYGSEVDSTLRASIFSSTIGYDYVPQNPAIIYDPNATHINSADEFEDTYVGWLGGSWTLPRFNPQTGQNELTEYVPLAIPNMAQGVAQLVANQTATQQGIVPESPTVPDFLPDYISNLFSNLEFNFPNFEIPEFNTGDTPTIVLPSSPTGSANKLYTVYNPSNSQLDSLGGYLWDADIIRTISEMFSNNPMDAIISLHTIYVTPSVNGTHNIILGHLNSGVSSNVVNNQYVTINCGTVKIPEKYGDYRDYDTSTVEIYLPFIGIRNISPNDAINCAINVKYTVDVYTGSCYCELIITKGNTTKTLYTFEGNCSVQIPLTGSDRSRILGTIATSVGSLIGGNVPLAVTSAISGVASGSAQSNISRSSSFSGNCGAMACKKPYIIVTYRKSSKPQLYESLIGTPTSRTTYLKNEQGFVRVKNIHMDNLNCTDIEKSMIETALKTGVII